MASFDYNPITGQLDLVGSGGGTSYIDGDVEYHSNLPVTVGTPAVNSAFLVRKGEGLYFISRKPAGIWVRELNNGNLDDWKYAGTFSDLYRDANFRIINNADVSKELAFDVSGVTTGTTRTLTVPNASGTITLNGHTHAASDITSGSFGNISHDGKLGSTAGLPVVTTTAGAVTTLALGTANQVLRVNSGASGVEFADPSGGGVTGAAASASDVLGVSGSDITGVDAGSADRLVFWDDSASKLTYLEAGSGLSISGTTLTATGGGVTAVGASTADVFSISGSDLVADDPNADRLVMYDDSASKLTHATAGKGLSFDGTTLNSATAFPVDPISRGPTYISYIGATSSGGNSSSAVNTSGGYVVFAPVYIRKSGNYTTFSCIVSTAGSASSLGKMALYTIDPTDATPDALVCESGTFTADSTGLKQPTMASTFVNEGWYYMALGTNSTTNMAFYGDTMITLRGVFSGAAFNTPAVLLDYSQKLYADFWPNPWDGTNTTFRNAFHPITSLT